MSDKIHSFTLIEHYHKTLSSFTDRFEEARPENEIKERKGYRKLNNRSERRALSHVCEQTPFYSEFL